MFSKDAPITISVLLNYASSVLFPSLSLSLPLFIVRRSAQHPQKPRFLQIFRGIWPLPLSLLNHSALALFAQRTRIPTYSRIIGFCAIWVCVSSSSLSLFLSLSLIFDAGSSILFSISRLVPSSFLPSFLPFFHSHFSSGVGSPEKGKQSPPFPSLRLPCWPA